MDLMRANKLTAYWLGDGVANGVFYKTHDKLMEVKSDDESVVGAGFTMPVGTEEVPVTAAEKLDAYKAFLIANASVFGIAYDPVDRRADEFKFPSKYDEAAFLEYSNKMLTNAVTNVLTSVQSNVVDKMVKAGHVVEGTLVQFAIGTGEVEISESYANGNIKFATAKYPVILAVGGTQMTTTAKVDLVSGQLKKPREIGETVMTMTGVKGLLIENGLLPKIEKPVKEDSVEETAATTEDSTEVAE